MTQKLSATSIFLLLGLLIFTIGIVLPFSSGLSRNRINETSIIFDYADGFYETTLRGYESITGRVSIVIILLVATILLFTKKGWHKYFLFPPGIIYLLFQISSIISTLAGFGLPHGNNLHIGFIVMILGTTLVFVSAVIKPTINTKHQPHDF